MKASALMGLVAAVALLVATASAAPSGSSQLPQATGNKQEVMMKKPNRDLRPGRRRPGQPYYTGHRSMAFLEVMMKKPNRDSRPGRRRPGQPYYTGHRSVAFLMMGEVDVMKHVTHGVESVSGLDPCVGCCDDTGSLSPTGGWEDGRGGIAQEAPAGHDVSTARRNIEAEPGLGVIPDPGMESISNPTADRCWGCCVATEDAWTTPQPGMGGGGGGRTDRSMGAATEGTGSQAPRKTSQTQPLQHPREKIRRRGSSDVSSSEEIGAGIFGTRRRGAAGRTVVAEGVRWFPRGSCTSTAESSSSQSSSEEARPAKHVRSWESKPSPARRG